MRGRLLLLAGLAWAFAWAAGAAMAQAPFESPRSGTILGRLDDFGRSIFGIRPAGREMTGTQAVRAEAVPYAADSTAAAQGASGEYPRPAVRPAAASPNSPRYFTRSQPEDESAQALSRGQSSAPAATPIHERLSGFRQSVFGGGRDSSSTAPPPVGLPATAKSSPAVPYGPPSESPRVPAAKPDAVRVAEREVYSPGVMSQMPLLEPAETPSSPSSNLPATSASAPPLGPPDLPKSEESLSAEPPKSGGDAATFTRQSPVLGVETVGPRRIAVGKEASYEIVLRNAGEVAAEQVVLTIDVPEWTDVTSAETTAGTTNAGKTKDDGGQFRWRIGRLEAKGRERLVLKLVPRQSRPFELAAKWDYTPAPSQGMIEVQEPKLKIALLGPREVLFGKGEIYRLELANAGNGDADNVVISLTPSSPGEKQTPATHRFGTLVAGQKKSIDVELTARQMGELLIRVEARGDGGLFSDLSEKISVRRATLQVDVETPKVHFVGTEGTYKIHVTNPGTAPAKNLSVSAVLPSGTRFLSSPQGGRLVPEQNMVVWSLESIAPGGDSTIAMSCDVSTPGVSRLEVQCKAEGDLKATTTATVPVEALPKLSLAVDDPAGPVMLGSEAAYVIQIQNRGSAAAEKVEVVAYFSNGFEPTTAEGGQHKINPGEVVFQPIASLAAGQAMSFKVHAKADAPGSHIFRVEVRSEPSGARLVREGTTRFFGSGAAAPPVSVARTLEKPSPASKTDPPK